MKNIIYIRKSFKGGCDGTASYCHILYEMFKNDHDCKASEIINYPEIKSRFFHYYYKENPLRKAIKNADIVHINGYTAMGTVQALLTAKFLGKKVVYTAHWHPFERLRHPLLGKSFFNIFLKNTIRYCANVVTTINNDDYRFFKSFHHNVVKIPHCCPPLLNPSSTKKNNKMILFVGRVDDPVKGFFHLNELPFGKFEIHCVGKGNINQRKDIIQHINISDEELAELYAQASLVVIPSKYEAFSYVALESLSYGTPVVMSENVRIADYLDGVSGVSIFKYGDIMDFQQKIEITLGQKVDVARISKIFNPQRIRTEYKDLYLSI